MRAGEVPTTASRVAASRWIGPPAVVRQTGEEGVADEPVTEPVAAGVDLDHSGRRGRRRAGRTRPPRRDRTGRRRGRCRRPHRRWRRAGARHAAPRAGRPDSHRRLWRLPAPPTAHRQRATTPPRPTRPCRSRRPAPGCRRGRAVRARSPAPRPDRGGWPARPRPARQQASGGRRRRPAGCGTRLGRGGAAGGATRRRRPGGRRRRATRRWCRLPGGRARRPRRTAGGGRRRPSSAARRRPWRARAPIGGRRPARRAAPGATGTCPPVPPAPVRTATRLRSPTLPRARPATPGSQPGRRWFRGTPSSRCRPDRSRTPPALAPRRRAPAPRRTRPARPGGRRGPDRRQTAPPPRRGRRRGARREAPPRVALGPTPSSRRSARSSRSNWRSAARWSPASANDRMSAMWASSSVGSTATSASHRPACRSSRWWMASARSRATSLHGS